MQVYYEIKEPEKEKDKKEELLYFKIMQFKDYMTIPCIYRNKTSRNKQNDINEEKTETEKTETDNRCPKTNKIDVCVCVCMCFFIVFFVFFFLLHFPKNVFFCEFLFPFLFTAQVYGIPCSSYKP